MMKKPLKILIACDKYKGSLSADDVCTILEEGIMTYHSHAECFAQPLADGGDGTVSIIRKFLGLQPVNVATIDPLNRPIEAAYYHSDDTAYVELAECSGISQLTPTELNPMITHCIGTGKLIRQAIKDGYRKITLCIGGSCTNEAGLSIGHALGFKFLDKDQRELIPTGGNLAEIVHINPPELDVDVSMTILCDVNNPLYGLNGAAHAFAAQKGAADHEILRLDDGLRHIASLLERYTGQSVKDLQGGGAAGGIAAGLHALLGGKLISGFTYISEMIQLEDGIRQADIVITGEGYLDSQSFDGKVIGQMATLCQLHDKPLIAVVGGTNLDRRKLNANGITALYQIMDHALDQEDAITNATRYLTQISATLKI